MELKNRRPTAILHRALWVATTSVRIRVSRLSVLPAAHIANVAVGVCRAQFELSAPRWRGQPALTRLMELCRLIPNGS